MNNNTYMANREVCDWIFEEYVSKKQALRLNYANVSTFDMTGETVFAHGGANHPPLIAFNGEKKGTIKIETQIQPVDLYRFITGATVSETATFIEREEFTTTTEAPTITLSSEPASGYPVNVFLASDECGTIVPSTVAAKVVTLTTPTPGSYVVYYMKSLTGVSNLSIKSSTFPGFYRAYGTTLDFTDSGVPVKKKMLVYKCKPQPNFSINNSNTGDPTTLTITCDVMADGNENMIDIISDPN